MCRRAAAAGQSAVSGDAGRSTRIDGTHRVSGPRPSSAARVVDQGLGKCPRGLAEVPRAASRDVVVRDRRPDDRLGSLHVRGY